MLKNGVLLQLGTATAQATRNSYHNKSQKIKPYDP